MQKGLTQVIKAHKTTVTRHHGAALSDIVQFICILPKAPVVFG